MFCRALLILVDRAIKGLDSAEETDVSYCERLLGEIYFSSTDKLIQFCR